MYTPEDRERVRTDVIAAARVDPRIGGSALTGSASLGREDRWSDIGLHDLLASTRAAVAGTAPGR